MTSYITHHQQPQGIVSLSLSFRYLINLLIHLSCNFFIFKLIIHFTESHSLHNYIRYNGNIEITVSTFYELIMPNLS